MQLFYVLCKSYDVAITHIYYLRTTHNSETPSISTNISSEGHIMVEDEVSTKETN
jgi:hypothetical protein